MIRYDLSASDYHAHTAVSKSQLDEIARSPAHFAAKYITGERKREETKAMRLGTALHTAVLEPERFQSEYIVQPYFGHGNAKATKEAKAEFESVNAKKIIIDEDDRVAILGMAESFSRSATSSVLLGRSLRREASVFWKDDATEIECRCRPDALSDDGAVIVDLKTTDDASPAAFAKSIAKYGYHRQAAFYVDGVEAATGKRPAFVFAVVEKTAPFACAFYSLDDASAEQGRRENRRNLLTLVACRASGNWPGYVDQIQMISLPAWAQERSDFYV